MQRSAQYRPPRDGLLFDLSGLVVETIRPQEEYSGKRARFRVLLGNARIAVQFGIGFGDAVVIEPEEVTYPTMLPSLPAPSLRAWRREWTMAEKFEAMVRFDTQVVPELLWEVPAVMSDDRAEPLPNRVCPRCGAANLCAPAASGSFDTECWCTRASVSRQALSEIPAELMGESCLCPACAALPDPRPVSE